MPTWQGLMERLYHDPSARRACLSWLVLLPLLKRLQNLHLIRKLQRKGRVPPLRLRSQGACLTVNQQLRWLLRHRGWLLILVGSPEAAGRRESAKDLILRPGKDSSSRCLHLS